MAFKMESHVGGECVARRSLMGWQQIDKDRPSAPHAQKREPSTSVNHFVGVYSSYKAHENQSGRVGMQPESFIVYQEIKLLQN